ncbi:MAG TPA: AI-2E family transporter [Methylomirabilota bacterium]|jgi:predicted PurR-regulated permease PerM|nr:AI-2E family transporter [Methylomirabilota bacterium]
MSLFDARAARVTLTVAAMLLVAGLLYLLRHLLLLLVFSVFLAYLLFPLVRLLERGCRRRVWAILAVYAILLVGLGFLGGAVGRRLASEVATLAEKLPEMSQRVQSGAVVGSVLEQRGWEAEQVREVERLVGGYTHQMVGYAQGAIGRALKWLAGAWVIVLIPVFAFFVLKDAEAIMAGAAALLENRRHRQLWRSIAADVDVLLADYVRALLLLSAITFGVWSAVFALAGVPYPLVLAAIGGALEFIPIVGPLSAGVIVVGVSLFSGYEHPWLLAGFLLLWRGVQDYLSSPLIMGRGAELHPALVIAGVLAGGEIGGTAGMFLSVPVIAALRIIWRRLREPSAERAASPPRAA